MYSYVLLLVGVAILVVSISRSRGAGSLWLLDPRGPAAGLMFLHCCGYLIYRAWNGAFPSSFGWVPSFADQANLMLVLGQLGFLLGTFVPVGKLAQRSPALSLDEGSERVFLILLAAAVVLTNAPAMWDVFTNWGSMSQMRYGGAVGNSDDIAKDYARVGNVSLIATPTLLMLLLSVGMTKRRILSIGTTLLTIYCLIPSLVSGSRKDTFLILAGLFLAAGFRWAKRPWARAAGFALALTVLSTVITRSRSGSSLGLEDRIAAAQDSSDDSGVVDRLSMMYAGTPSMTAVMTIFPRFGGYTYGRSYYEAGVNVTSPAFITGRYPYLPMAHQFRLLYYADVKGYGFDYALFAEAYQNFGFFGPLLIGMLAGAFLAWTYSLATQVRNTVNPWTLFHLMALVTCLYGLRTDSNGLFKGIVYSGVWILGITWASQTINRATGGIIMRKAKALLPAVERKRTPEVKG